MNYSDSDSNGSFFYRFPGLFRLVPLRTPTGEIYNPRDLYPAGFTPRFAGNVIDMSFTGGIRGEFNNGMLYDFGGRWGESTIKYTIFNTMNASLGPETPTSFRPGDLVSDESAFNADFVMPVDVGFASDLNVAFGLEYRDEGYELVEGGLKSYEQGVYAFADPFNFEIDADEAAAGQNGGSVGCFIPGPSSIRPVFAILAIPFTTSAWSDRTDFRAIDRRPHRPMAGTAGRLISISKQTSLTASWHRSRADTKTFLTLGLISAGGWPLACR